ncbi:putative ABC transport system ATP-binding protein [Microbacterium sp. AG1240]|uniref:ABC transporter ATP-binding protein n=1 Tax=Microbacterium sp. AG1240 TaxID=2183992 RepID=UPI000F2C1EE3|nr:ABC transporter ATP-binding protein [Microbacterium sp. AG1240]RKT36277.1 putative ABC transport system ATP-binding protein [Microbacterium sp. AG1240]
MTRRMVHAEGLVRVFGGGALRTVAVDGIDIDVSAGEVVVVRGPSGSGKTTLLSLLAGIDVPDAGTAWIDDVEVTRASETDLAGLRAQTVGFIAQDFALVEMLTAAENVELPLRIARTPVTERGARVAEALEAVGLTPHARQRPDQLSGGQQQRVAIARALVHRPRVLLADEPTAQLDSASARTVMELIAERVHRDDMAAVVTTHDPELAAIADRVIEIHDGRLGALAPTSRAQARRRRMLRGEAPA